MYIDKSPTRHQQLTNVAAFLIPALVLWLPSGYAYGAAILTIGGLWTISVWSKSKPVLNIGYVLALVIIVMSAIWLFGSDWSKGVAVLNRPVRYLLLLPCLFYVLYYPPKLTYFRNGILAGAAAGGLYAAFDVIVLKVGRAWTTVHSTANVIQLGDLSGLLGLFCWLQLVLFWRRWSMLQRGLAVVCGALGLIGSLLSQSRGGWVGLMICLPFLFILVARHLSFRRASAGIIVLILLLMPLSLYFSGILKNRIDEAVSQVIAYQRSGDSQTSVGQRLFMWKQAFEMGLKKPLLGWGDAGYTNEKIRQVDMGQASGMELDYKDAHNEIVDMFAKRGIIGVFALLLQYIVPFLLFWRAGGDDVRDGASNKLGRTQQLVNDMLTVRAIGATIPVAFFGFGLTQTYFSHYNGINMYWLMIILSYAILHRLMRDRDQPDVRSFEGRDGSICDKLRTGVAVSDISARR